MGQVAGQSVTSGGGQGMSGEERAASVLRDPRALTAAAFTGLGLLYTVVNAASLIDQREALGRPIAAWQAWVLEGTSFAAWLALVPVLLALAVRLVRCPLWLAVVGHAGACLALSLAHTALMTLLRLGAFAFFGEAYALAEPLGDRLLFEARKDVITYVSLVAVFLTARRVLGLPADQPAGPPTASAIIEVRDGSKVRLFRFDEIDWVNAAGNYVEFNGAFGSQLARRTMADMAAELAPHGFVRVHRSRLVRRDAIASIATHQSGDCDITLRSGVVISGSRRYRRNLS
ncbi:MAG: LytTR family transcriptional regulator [Porphyrobacter sp.]|nr:LytTR family transcriptional regulator [Porphyrobacter sp.]